MSDEEKERFVRLVQIISKIKPEDPCVGSDEFLTCIQEMQKWQVGKTPFITQEFLKNLEKITHATTIVRSPPKSSRRGF